MASVTQEDQIPAMEANSQHDVGNSMQAAASSSTPSPLSSSSNPIDAFDLSYPNPFDLSAAPGPPEEATRAVINSAAWIDTLPDRPQGGPDPASETVELNDFFREIGRDASVEATSDNFEMDDGTDEVFYNFFTEPIAATLRSLDAEAGIEGLPADENIPPPQTTLPPTTLPIATLPSTTLPLPHSDFLKLKDISGKIDFTRELTDNIRELLVGAVSAFSHEVTHAHEVPVGTMSVSGETTGPVPDVNHQDLSKRFAHILVLGGKYAIGMPNLKDAYFMWMNSGPADLTIWAFYEFCYLPICQAIKTANMSTAKEHQELLWAWEKFCSDGIEGFPRIDPEPFNRLPTFELKDDKIKARRAAVEMKEQEANLLGTVELRCDQPSSPKVDENLFQDMNAAEAQPRPRPSHNKPPISTYDAVKKKDKKEKGIDEHEELIKRAMKPGAKDPVLGQWNGHMKMNAFGDVDYI